MNNFWLTKNIGIIDGFATDTSIYFVSTVDESAFLEYVGYLDSTLPEFSFEVKDTVGGKIYTLISEKEPEEIETTAGTMGDEILPQLINQEGTTQLWSVPPEMRDAFCRTLPREAKVKINFDFCEELTVYNMKLHPTTRVYIEVNYE